MSPLDDPDSFTTFLILLTNGLFAVGFVIMDPVMGPLVHRQIYTLKQEAEQALAEIEIDLFDRPLAPSRSNDNTNIYTSLGE